MKNAAKLFHSLLYTYILRNDLISAVSFIDNLILKANPHAVGNLDPNTQAQHSDLQPSLMTFVTSTLKCQVKGKCEMEQIALKSLNLFCLLFQIFSYLLSHLCNHMQFKFYLSTQIIFLHYSPHYFLIYVVV